LSKKTQGQNKSEKEGEGDKKPNQKRRKDNKMLNQKSEKGREIFLIKRQ
jgi:hypothetical protein